MLEIKDTITEIKNTFNELVSRFDIVKQIISKLENRSIKTFQTDWKKRKTITKKKYQNRTSKNCGAV